jgi:hypothetical protein
MRSSTRINKGNSQVQDIRKFTSARYKDTQNAKPAAKPKLAG